MTTSKPHDPDDPQGHLNAIEMAWWASDSTRAKCLTCNVRLQMLAGPGSTWLVEEFHETTCPMHEDYQAPSEAW